MSATEDQKQADAYVAAMRQLPLERQKAVAHWYRLQKATAEALGVEEKNWWETIAWAMSHPLDFSFAEHLIQAGAVDGDAAVAAAVDPATEARKMLGYQVGTTTINETVSLAEKAKGDNELDKEIFKKFLHAPRRR